MNVIIETINAAGQIFIEFALPMFIQSSALILILLMIDVVLRRRVRAVFRYWIWMLVLLKLVLPPSLWSPVSIGTWLGATLEPPALERQERATVLRSPEAKVSPEPVDWIGDGTTAGLNRVPQEYAPVPRVLSADDGYTMETSQAARPTPDGMTAKADAALSPTTPLSWPALVLLAWLAIALALLLLLIQRAWFVRGLIAQSQEAPPRLRDALDQCCLRIGVKRAVPMRVSSNATSPAVCGLFRPSILIPKTLVPRLQPHDLQAVLLHELAHIKRGDLWVNLIQTLLQVIYFYNPLLWLANLVIRRVREQAVDETVLVAMGEAAHDYPETLLNVAKLAFRQRPVLSLRLIGVVESKSALRSRIKHILHRPLPKTAKLGLLGLVAVCLIAALLLPMARASEETISVVNNGPLDIRLIGVCPDGDGQLYDTNGKKLNVTMPPLGTSEGPWDSNEVRRDFVFEVLDVDERLLFDRYSRVRPPHVEKAIGGGFTEFNPLIDPSRLVLSAEFDRTYPEPGTGSSPRHLPVRKVDVTLRYFLGPRGEASCTFTGPFTPGTTVQADDGCPDELTPELTGLSIEPRLVFCLTTNQPVERNVPVIVYDDDGIRYLAFNVGSNGGRLRYRADAVGWDRVAAITVGEQPYEITFQNVVVDYPGHLQRTYPEHLDRVAERLNLTAWSPDDVIQYDLRHLPDIVAVLDVVRSSDLIGKVTEAFYSDSPCLDFTGLDPAIQEKIRATAASWVDSPYRMDGIVLGLVGHWPEFFDLAMGRLQGDCPALGYYPERETTWRLRSQMIAHVLEKRWGPLSASEVEKLKGCIRKTTDEWVLTSLFECLETTNSPEATNALRELALDERPWIWWHATEMWCERVSRADWADDSLPEEMKLKLYLVKSRPVDADMKAKARALLAEQLAPQLSMMLHSDWNAINTEILRQFDRTTVTQIYIDYLRRMQSVIADRELDGPISGWASFHIAEVVCLLNLWYDMNIGNLGTSWTRKAYGGKRPTYAVLDSVISEVLTWYAANPNPVPEELSLEGQVVDEAGQPIVNAEVTLEKYEEYRTASGIPVPRDIDVDTCRTDFDGYFTFTGLGDHARYGVNIVAAGYMGPKRTLVHQLSDGRYEFSDGRTIKMGRSDEADGRVSGGLMPETSPVFDSLKGIWGLLFKGDTAVEQLKGVSIGLPLTERAEKVVLLAEEEARQLNHRYIGTEHILLALARQKDAVSAKVLADLGADLDTVRTEVNQFVRPGAEPVVQRTLPCTSRAERVIHYAEYEARILGHDYIGTEHILLGLMREPKGVAAQVLTSLGVTSQQIRTEVLKLVRPGSKADDEATDTASEAENGKGAGGGALAASGQAERSEANDGNSSSVVAELPNGITVELLGACEHPPGGRRWWGPDGSALNETPYNWPGALVAPNDPNTLPFELALRVRNLPEGWKATVESVGSSYSNSDDAPFKAGRRLYDLRWLMMEAEPNQTTCTIRCNIAEPWETVARSTPQISGLRPATGDDVVFSEIRVEPKPLVRVTVTGRLISRLDEQAMGNRDLHRIVAIPEDGAKEGISSAGFYTREGPDSITAYFLRRSTAGIKELQFQTRARTSVVFDHVSLRRGQETTVGVHVESEEAAGAGNVVVLPEVDVKGVIFDLATGKLIPLPPVGPEPAKLQEALRALGQGDIVYDVDLGDHTLILLRDATSEQAQEDTGEPGIQSYLVGRNLPETVIVTTAEGRRYEVTILAAGEETCTLKYALLSADEGAGGGILVEPPEVRSSDIAAMGPYRTLEVEYSPSLEDGIVLSADGRRFLLTVRRPSLPPSDRIHAEVLTAADDLDIRLRYGRYDGSIAAARHISPRAASGQRPSNAVLSHRFQISEWPENLKRIYVDYRTAVQRGMRRNVNTPAFAETGRGPLGRHALSFDGVDDCLIVPPGLSLSSPFSIEVWLKTDPQEQARPLMTLIQKGRKPADPTRIQDGGLLVSGGRFTRPKPHASMPLYLGQEDGRMFQAGGARLGDISRSSGLVSPVHKLRG